MRERPATTASVQAYLLLLPAFVLLIAFTHYPAVATLIDSFFPRPKVRGPRAGWGWKITR